MTAINAEVMLASSVDISAACEQSGRIAREDQMPSCADRMDKHAQDIREGAKIVLLGHTVLFESNGTMVTRWSERDITYEMVISIATVDTDITATLH